MKYKQIKRGEIYYADLNPVVGSEQGGRRPVLILQNDIINKHSPVTIVAAITSNRDKTYLPNDIAINPACLPLPSAVLLGQIRTIDKTRLEDYVGRLDKTSMDEVDRGIVSSFGIKYLEDLLK